MTDTLYASCAQVLSVCQSVKDDLAALLHPETGFAPRLRQLCRDQYVCKLSEYASHQSVPHILSFVALLDWWS